MGIQLWERRMKRGTGVLSPVLPPTGSLRLCDLRQLTQLSGPKSPRQNTGCLRFPIGGAILPYSGVSFASQRFN